MSKDNLLKSGILKTLKSLLFALIVALFIRYIFIQPFKIPSKSMYPTLMVGDHLLVDRLSYGFALPCSDTKLIKSFKNFQRGDIIVFRYPIEEDAINCPNGGFIGLTSTYYIKRIIGLPGDKIKLLDKDIYVNGVKISNNIEESKYFLDGENHEVYINRFDVKEIMTIYKEESKRYQENISNLEIIVPLNKYFVLGDNRDNSKDSRYWGYVPKENIIGKALIIHFSWNNNFKNVKDIIRFERFFNLIE